MKQLEEFKRLEFKRDEEYFKEGFATWEVTWRKKKWYVNAIYREETLVKNENSKDYTNGIKAFELCTSTLRPIKTFKVSSKAPIISLQEVENYIVDHL